MRLHLHVPRKSRPAPLRSGRNAILILIQVILHIRLDFDLARAAHQGLEAAQLDPELGGLRQDMRVIRGRLEDLLHGAAHRAVGLFEVAHLRLQLRDRVFFPVPVRPLRQSDLGPSTLREG